MSIATANHPLHTPILYWSVPVTGASARCCGYTPLCLFLRLPNGCFEQPTDPAKGPRIPNTSGSAISCRKTQTQIPITLLPDLAPLPHPAVSSPEASQTPAR